VAISIPGILHYRHDIIPALIDAGVNVGDLGGSLIVGSGVIDYVAVTRCHGRTRFERVVQSVDTDVVLARWGVDVSASVVLFPAGVAQAVVTYGERECVEGWILIDVSDVDIPMSC